MKKLLTLFVLMLSIFAKTFAQADCSSATIICGNTQAFNPSGVGQVWEQLACGGVEHNSQWIAFQAQATGPLNFTLRPYTLDGLPSAIDFDWTLYQLPGNPNTTNCNAKIALQCNFASVSSALGIPGITGLASPPLASVALNQSIQVTAGTWYTLHIDQFTNTTPQVVSVQFTGNPESPFLNSGAGIFANEPNFSFASTGCTNVFNFTNTSTSTVGIASYLWDFGDGTTSTAISPSKTFLQPGTYYVTLRMTDNNGCNTFIKKGVTFATTNPTLTSANIFTSAACTDANNGVIRINYNGDGNTTNGVSGGTPGYMYELVNPSPMVRPMQASNVFSGLQPGIYTVKVTDACGRVGTTTVTVAQILTNTAMTFTGSIFQASCATLATGSVYFNVTGSVPPYTIESVAPSPVISGPFTAIQQTPTSATFSYNFTNLLPGVYLFKATDACGKTQFINVTVAVSQAPTVTVVNTSSCINTPTGSITVNATGGTPGGSGTGSPGTFQYALIAPSAILKPYQNSSLFEGLLPGTYRVSVRDACGNEANATTTIAASIAPAMGTHFTTASCPNGATGTIEVNVTASNSGGGPLTYELIAPSQLLKAPQTNNTFTALPPGNYTIKLTNNCGLSATSTATITAAAAPSFTTTNTASCTIPANGSIQVAPSATGIAPFTFSLISPSTQVAPVQGSNIANTTNSIFKNLPQGSYTVQMTDGCGSPVTNIVTVAAPTALVATTNTTIASCAASATGQLTAAVPATGSAPYTYELILPSPIVRPAQASNVFNNLSAGANYTVRITDACGTQISNAVSTIATVAAPSLTVTNTASCAASSTGTITAKVNAQGGGGAYQFALIAPSPVTAPNQSSPIFTGLPNGAYTVQITDVCGVTATTTTTLATTLPTPTAAATLMGCSGLGYTYRISVTPQSFTPGGPIQGGGGAYTYALYDAANTVLVQGPQSTPNFLNVPAGVGYTVRFTDVCGTTATVAITAATVTPAALVTGILTATQLSCSATPNGIITSTLATGGLAPYTYTLIDPAGPTVIQPAQSDRVFTGVPALAAGYQVRTTDACGNIVNSVTLPFAAVVAPTVTVVTTASCTAGTNGTVTATIATIGGGGTYLYTLLDAAGAVTIAGPQSSPLFTGLAPATYTIRVTDFCNVNSTAVGNAVVSNVATALTSTATASLGTCGAGATGVVTGASTGGVLPVTYSLVDNATTTVIQGPQTGNVFSNVPAGVYVVRTIDACGTVTNSTTATITNLVAVPALTSSIAVKCDANILSAYGSGGAGAPFTYAICTGVACSGFGAYSTTNQFSLAAGTYRLSVKDKCGNITNSAADIVIVNAAKPSLTAATISNTNCASADVTAVTAAANGALGTIQYSLNNAAFSNALPTAITAGCKTLKVRYLNGTSSSCESDNLPFLVYPNAVVSPVTFTNCSTPLGTIDAVATVAAAPADFVWEYSLNNVTFQSSNTFTGLPLNTANTVYVRGKYTGVTCANIATTCIQTRAFTTPATCAPLAIDGLKISGQVTGATNTIYWSTETETNNNKFVVERSVNGNVFSKIGEVNTKAVNGNSSVTLNYEFVDANPLEGKALYRLQVVDNINIVKYSPIVTLRRGSNKLEIVDVHPNPTNGIVYFNILSFNKAVKISLLNVSGQVLINKGIVRNNNFSIDMSKYASGIYVIEAKDLNTGEKSIFKIVKK
jgi:PKD repeat protein